MAMILTVDAARQACADGSIGKIIQPYGVSPEICYTALNGQPFTISQVRSVNFSPLLLRYAPGENNFPRFVMKAMFRNMPVLVVQTSGQRQLMVGEFTEAYIKGLLTGKVPYFDGYQLLVVPYGPDSHLSRPEWLESDPIKATLMTFVDSAFNKRYEFEELFEAVGVQMDNHVSSSAVKPEIIKALFECVLERRGDAKQRLVNLMRQKRDRRVAEIPDWF